MINDCFDIFKDMLKYNKICFLLNIYKRFIETGTMNLLDHFHNYEIPQNYIANEEVVYYDESKQPLMKSFSKHYNNNLWNKSLCCEAYRPAKETVDFKELKIYSHTRNASSGPLTNWVSEQKERSFDVLSRKGIIFAYYLDEIIK